MFSGMALLCAFTVLCEVSFTPISLWAKLQGSNLMQFSTSECSCKKKGFVNKPLSLIQETHGSFRVKWRNSLDTCLAVVEKEALQACQQAWANIPRELFTSDVWFDHWYDLFGRGRSYPVLWDAHEHWLSKTADLFTQWLTTFTDNEPQHASVI